jgi:acetyl esterase/lipase
LRAAHPQSLDLRYGEAERNRIDLFVAGKHAPLLVFIHGGYWQMRAKETFSFLAAGALANGINVAMPGYTLAPAKRLDAIVAEIHAALDFLQNRNPSTRMVVSGWSAGGHLAAMALAHPGVSAGLAISGIYDLEPIRLCYLNDKLRLDAAEAQRNSPLRLPGVSKPLVLAYGTAELPELQRQSREYAAARAEAALPGRVVPMEGHNHFTILERLADPRGELAALVSELAAR